MNRVLTGHMADLHFAPTERNKQNLLKEGIEEGILLLETQLLMHCLQWPESLMNSRMKY